MHRTFVQEHLLETSAESLAPWWQYRPDLPLGRKICSAASLQRRNTASAASLRISPSSLSLTHSRPCDVRLQLGVMQRHTNEFSQELDRIHTSMAGARSGHLRAQTHNRTSERIFPGFDESHVRTHLPVLL